MKFVAAAVEKITRRRRMKMGEEKQVDAVLYAEFDIDKGSTLRESYPRAIPDYSPEFFADVMLPEGVHNRQQDFTIFFLNRDKRRGVTTSVAGDDGVKQDDSADENDPLKEFMYCLSVVRTHLDATVRRGARVKAVALCSRHKFSFAFKSVLEVAVSKLAVAKDEAETKHVLEELYAVVNAVQSGGARNISDVERRLLKSQIDVSGSKSLVEQKAQEESLYYHTTAPWGEQKIPLKFKLCSTEDQFDEGLLRRLLLKFGEQSMVLYNAVLTGQRVIVLGYNQPAGDVCNYVLAMSSLVCPPLSGLIQRQYPYANLTDLSFLSTPGFIAGVTNPMFKSKRDWWDVLCDISNGEVLLSAQAERDEFEVADRTFVQEVLDGIHAGYSEEWVRCQFEEYTLQNVVDLAVGEANYMDVEALARKTAVNNKRITRWARTDNYKSFVDSRQLVKAHTDAFNAGKTGIDLRKHIRSLQGDMVIPEESHVESIYADLASLLHTEQELQEFLSYLPSTRGGLQAVAQGIYHTSMSVKYNTVLLLQRLESFPSTASSLQQLNAFVLMTYQRIHNIVQPDVRQ